MAINKGIIAKKINGEVEQIYPKTSADMVICEDNESVEAKLQSIETTNEQLSSQISSFQGGMKYVSSLNDMTDTSRAYVCNGEWYYYDSTAEEWTSGGEVAGIETDNTLTISGAAADAAEVGNKLFKIQIVNQRPATGVANTIYLISKGANKGYDKYWWITDNGVSKWDIFGGSSTEVVSSLPNSGDEDIDYILTANNGYFYYKWINNDWRVIGGSLATVVDDIDDLPETGNELTDYYVAQSNGSYQHYRWKDAEDENDESGYHIVGGDSYTKSEVDTLLATINGNIATNTSNISTLNTTIGTIQSSLSTANADITEIQQTLDSIDDQVYKYNVTYGKAVVDGEEKENVFRLYQYKGDDFDETDEESIIQEFVIEGGGGVATNVSAKINYEKDSNNKNITTIDCAYGSDCNINFYLDAKDSDGEYSTIGNGIGSWYVSKDGKSWTLKASGIEIVNGNVLNTYNVGSYLSPGTNYVRLAVTVIDENGTSATVKKKWTVTAIDLNLQWEYNDLTINTITDNSLFDIFYTVSGDLDRTIHLTIDGQEVVSTAVAAPYIISLSSSNELYAEYLTSGSHTMSLYATTEIENADLTTTIITSNVVTHNVIFVSDTGNQAPIISSLLTSITVTQGNTIDISYSVYDPGNEEATIVYMRNSEEIGTDPGKARQTLYHWYYKPADSDYDENGAMTLGIKCGSTVKTFNITVKKLQLNIEETTGYAFKFNASTIASNNTLKEWSSNGVTINFSNNFDWVNGGIKQEVDNNGNVNQFLCIKAGTTATINYKLFANDASINGKNFKVIFKAVNVDNYDAVIIDCMDTNENENTDYVGIKLGANGGIIQNKENRGDSALKVQYSEETYIEFEYEICSNQNYTYYKTFIDGVMSDVKIYGGTINNFTQSTPKNIIIGSPNCDVYIYTVTVYEKELSMIEHLNNFILNAPNANEINDRYKRNNVYTIENGNIEIDPEELAKNNPNCRVHLWKIPEMPTQKYKKGKKQISDCEYEQIYNGIYLDDEGNEVNYSRLKATNVNIGVQGTSSLSYISSAANTDGEFLSGFDVCDSNEDIIDHIDAYSMEQNSIATNYFNTKVNVASCENINNMCLAEWYNRYQPYKTSYELKNPKARNCMEHHMGVQFIMDTHERNHAKGNDDNFHVFENDEKYHMYAICNMGNSKNSFGVFHDITNPNECCVETLDNDSDICMMKQALTMDTLYPANEDDTVFEFRYPKQPTSEMEQAFINFTAWMASCNPANATNEELEEPVTYYPYTFEGAGQGADVLAGTTVYQYGCEYDDTVGDFVWYDDVDSEGNPIKVRREGRTFTHDTFSYRVAKMLNECEDHLIMDSIVYHYVFVEQHAMVDNACKNTFWGTEDLVHWHLVKNYDNDTADGNDNTGKLTIPSCAEGLDNKSSGAGVFNGNGHAYWQFVYGLYEARKTMWQNRASEGAWNYEDYLRFASERQKCIPEIVWNKDYWYKYLRPYETSNEIKYVNMFFGGQKAHQRKYFVTDNYWYMASQYNAGRYTSSSISFRSYAPSNAILMPKSEIQIMLYRDGYITFAIGNKQVRTKAKRNQFKTLSFENNSTNDSVISIFGSVNIKAIGDMSSLYAADVTIVNAPRLKSLKINCVKKFEDTLTINANGNIIDSNNNIIGKLNSFIDDEGNIIKNISDDIYIDYNGIIHGKDQNNTTTTLGANGNISLDENGNVINNTTEAIIATGGVIVGKIGTATINNDDGDIIDSEGNIIDRCLNKVCNSVSIDNSVKMLEELYIQNCPNMLSPVFNAFNFQRLKVFNTRNSNINSVLFANGGLLEEVCINKPLGLFMRNLNGLTNANITIQDSSEMSSLLCESCSNIDSMQLLNRFKTEENGVISFNNLTNITITDIDWTLESKDLLDCLASLNGITVFQNNQGVDTAIQVDHSILAGRVHITGGSLRSSDINRYNSLWPNLSITYPDNILILQFKVTYKIDSIDNDGNGDVILGEVYVDQNGSPPNIGFIGSNTLNQDEFTEYGVTFPTKHKTIEQVFHFDHWNADDLNQIIINNRSTVTAVFVSEPRTYTVRWFAHPDDEEPVQVATGIDYGTGVEYNQNESTETNFDTGEKFADKVVRDLVDSAYICRSCSLFTGKWDKSTSMVLDDIDVYGIWESAVLPQLGKDLSEMSFAEMYTIVNSTDLCEYDEENNPDGYFQLKDHFDFEFDSDKKEEYIHRSLPEGEEPQEGHYYGVDIVKDGVYVYGGEEEEQETFFNNDKVIDTGIKLFDADSPSFVLAIQFNTLTGSSANNSSYNSIISCNDYANGKGFYINKKNSSGSGNPIFYYSGGSSKEFSGSIPYDTYGSGSHISTMIIKHAKGSKDLYLYSNYISLKSSMSENTNNHNVTKFTRSTDITTENITLLLGGMRSSSDNTINYGAGCIYNATVWYNTVDNEYTNGNFIFSDNEIYNIIDSYYDNRKCRMELYGFNLYNVSGSDSFVNMSFMSKTLSCVRSNSSSFNGIQDAYTPFKLDYYYNRLPRLLKKIIKPVQLKASWVSNAPDTAYSNHPTYADYNYEQYSSVIYTYSNSSSLYTRTGYKVYMPSWVEFTGKNYSSHNSNVINEGKQIPYLVDDNVNNIPNTIIRQSNNTSELSPSIMTIKYRNDNIWVDDSAAIYIYSVDPSNVDDNIINHGDIWVDVSYCRFYYKINSPFDKIRLKYLYSNDCGSNFSLAADNKGYWVTPTQYATRSPKYHKKHNQFYKPAQAGVGSWSLRTESAGYFIVTMQNTNTSTDVDNEISTYEDSPICFSI